MIVQLSYSQNYFFLCTLKIPQLLTLEVQAYKCWTHFSNKIWHDFLSKHNDIFCYSNSCICLLNLDPTSYHFNIIRKCIQVIAHILLMMVRFPNKLRSTFLLGLTNVELKFPNNFIPKLKSPIITRSEKFNKFLEDCENNTNEILIESSSDTISCAPRNHMFDFYINQWIPIQKAIDNLNVYDSMIF